MITEYTQLLKNKKIIDNGVRLQDSIIIFPLQGRNKELKLNFKSFNFLSQTSQLTSPPLFSYTLPTLEGDSFHLELKLQEGNRFFIQSKNLTPYFINGQQALSSWVQRGDCIEIANNKIFFIDKNNEQQDNENNFPFCKKIIRSKLNLLFEGETGTGKSHLAKSIHKKSSRIGPFIQINLESIPHSLIESELFGHQKGAFTGAIHNKKGALELADHGTLFLDEIDSLSPSIQCKLLLFLDNKTFRPLGSQKEKNTDVRLIFASGRSLKKLVEQKIMRKDFYYRISSGIVHQLKPLRECPELIEKLCYKFADENNIILPKELIKYYQILPWPGNIRQLKGHLQKKSILSNNRNVQFDIHDEALILDESPKETSQFVDMNTYKFLMAQKTYQTLKGQLNKTAKILKLSPSTLKGILEKPPAISSVKVEH